MGNTDVSTIKERYKQGTKIKVLEMNDPFPVESGSVGIVDHVDDIGNVHCIFENDRSIAVIPGVDRFVKYSI